MNALKDQVRVEPELMKVHLKNEDGSSGFTSYFIPDFLRESSDERLKSMVLNEVSMYASRLF